MLWLKVYCMVVFQTFSLKLYCFSDWAWAGPVHQDQRSSSRGSIIYITFRPCKTSSSTSGKSDNWPRRWSGISSIKCDQPPLFLRFINHCNGRAAGHGHGEEVDGQVSNSADVALISEEYNDRWAADDSEVKCDDHCAAQDTALGVRVRDADMEAGPGICHGWSGDQQIFDQSLFGQRARRWAKSQRPGHFHMDEYLLRNCDTGRWQPAGEEAILEKVLERGEGGGRDQDRLRHIVQGRGCPRSFVSHALHSASRQAPWSTTTRARWAVLCGDKIRYVAYAFHNVCSWYIVFSAGNIHHDEVNLKLLSSAPGLDDGLVKHV